MAGAALASVAPPCAAVAVDPWTLTLKSAIGWNDDVAISAIDATSRVGDGVADFEAATTYRITLTPTSNIVIGYDFSQSLHATLHAYDLQSHGLSATASTAFGGSTAAVAGSFYHLSLGSKSFLDLGVINPGLLTPLSHGFFLRTSLLYLNETFFVDHLRDAAHYQPGLQTFYFFDRARAFILVGVNYQKEATTGSEYDFGGYGLDASVTLPADALRKGTKLEAGYEWIRRDYDNATAAIAAPRRDRWSTLRFGLETPLTRGLSTRLDFSHIDRQSNLPAADYVENVIAAAIVFRH